ncbi:MAG: hypothetical protein V1813_02395 [Candidatus Aenigmatarchaeota archaeon]
MSDESFGPSANSQEPAGRKPVSITLTLADLDAAMKEYEFIVTYDRELDIVKGIIKSYKIQGIEADFREVKINPDCLIATQMFVDKLEHEVIGRLVKSGLYKVPIVEEFHPDVMHHRYALDGHNRGHWNAVLEINPIDAFEIYFPNGDLWTNYMRAAEALGNIHVRYMPIGSVGSL